MPDWITGWMPPGTPSEPDPVQMDTGFDFAAWLTGGFGGDTWQRARPGSAAYQQMAPGVDVGKWLQGLFTQSPEDQLTSLILDRMGGGAQISAASAMTGDPQATQAREYRITTARQAAHRAMDDPAYREQLAIAMGWNMKNPHVAYWVMHGGGVPSDPMSATPAPAGQAAPGGTTTTPAAPSSAIGAPFDAKAWGGRGSDPGFTYGAVLPPAIAAAAGIDRQWGVDYALPLGTALNSPFAGTIKEAGFNGPYGNTVVVQMANGYTYRVAHLQLIPAGVHVGATVAVGSLLGPVGSTGNSSGPHVLIEMRDARGKPINPTPIIDALLKGDTSGAQKYLGDYVSTEQGLGGPVRTDDGQLLYPGSDDYKVFFAAQSMWRKRYGGDPPWTFVSSLIAQGNTTTEQIQSVMDQMSSDIPGLNWGARDTLTNNANSAAQKAWDRTVPDATIKQLAAQGITTPGQIAGWINSHPASSLDKADYKSIYDVANAKTQELWQQPPSPDLVKHIHDQMNIGPQE